MGRIIIPGQEHEPQARSEQIDVAQVREYLRESIDRNNRVPRVEALQRRLDILTALAFAADDLALALCLTQLAAANVAGVTGVLSRLLADALAEMMPDIADYQECRVCGCRNDRPCLSGCEWVDIDLCSRCAQEGK